ncbi:MAG TPA: L-lactate permease [Chthoniobacterales bacterium]|jgi:L-lactate permease|nr:L-lactate permease [Chthoniobacterales bacterium]
MIGLLTTIFFARRGVGLTKDEANAAGSVARSTQSISLQSEASPLHRGDVLRALARILGDALAAGAGALWIYFAGFLGALGSFFSGSNTISNLTFGPIQLRIAQDLGVSSTTMLALQTVGAAMGNMVAIHNIVAVCAVLGLKTRKVTFSKRRLYLP